MPLDGSNNYYYPLGTPGVPNQTIESGKYNTFLDDLVMNDLNVPRPVSRGGTGASTPEGARTSLGVMPLTGGTMTGNINITPPAGNASILLNKPAGSTSNIIYGWVGGEPRWQIDLGDGTAETGSPPNAGTNFAIHRADDNGAYLGTAFTINRASGQTSINGVTNVNSTLDVIGRITTVDDLLVGGTSNTGVVRFGSASANYLYFDGTNYLLAGGPLHVGAFNAAGATTLTTLTAGTTGLGATTVTSLAAGPITCGVITASGLSSTGNINSNGSITCDAGMSCNNLTTNSLTVSGSAVWHAGNFNPASYLLLSGGTISGALSVTGDIRAGHGTASGKLVLGDTGQNPNFNLTNSDGWRLQGGAGGFHIDTNAVKPGGGTWDAPSDGRVKTLLGEYDHGLDQIRRLKPQRFKYKDRSFDLVKDREFIGFVAQDVEPVMPEMVSKKNGVIDGQEVTDFRMTDTTALIYALVNAVRELSNRVEELESAG